MEFAELHPLLLVLLIVAMILLSAWIFQFAAGAAGVKDVGYGKALVTNFCAAVASTIVNVILGLIPVVGPILGWLGGMFAASTVVAMMLKTTFGRGLLTLFYAWVLSTVVGFGLVLLLLRF